MIMAAGLRDILVSLIQEQYDDAEAGGDAEPISAHDERLIQEQHRLTEELTRVYWLCRARYAGAEADEKQSFSRTQLELPQPQLEGVLEADHYFEDWILSSDNFGARPDFLTC
jgi:hypothetical protein